MQVVLRSNAFSVIYLCSTSFQGILSFLENQCFLLCSIVPWRDTSFALRAGVSQWISSVTTFQGIPLKLQPVIGGESENNMLGRFQIQTYLNRYSEIIPVYFFQEKTLQSQVFEGFLKAASCVGCANGYQISRLKILCQTFFMFSFYPRGR